MSLRVIKNRIKSITSNTAKLNEYIHETAVMVVDHAKEHGDCTQALALCLAMPKSYRRNMLVDWFTMVSPINVNIAKETVSLRKVDAKQYAIFDMDKARGVKWFEMEQEEKDKKEPETLLVQVVDGFDAFIERMQKKIEKAEGEDQGLKSRLLADLHRALEAFHAIDGLPTKEVVEDDTAIVNKTLLAALKRASDAAKESAEEEHIEEAMRPNIRAAA